MPAPVLVAEGWGAPKAEPALLEAGVEVEVEECRGESAWGLSFSDRRAEAKYPASVSTSAGAPFSAVAAAVATAPEPCPSPCALP